MIDVLIVIRNKHGHTRHVWEKTIPVQYGSMQVVHVHARKMVAAAEKQWNVKCTYSYYVDGE